VRPVTNALRIVWAPVGVVLAHNGLAALIGHHREFDPVFHFLGGVAGAHAVLQGLVLFPRSTAFAPVARPRLVAVIAVAFVAGLWELGEFASDRVLGSHIQQGWLDTGSDIALGIAGAVVIAMIESTRKRDKSR
jgi:hypothetical protein